MSLLYDFNYVRMKLYNGNTISVLMVNYAGETQFH